MKTLHQNIEAASEQVRRSVPLVGSITNAITMDFVANAQLAAGGSAAMVYLGEEAEALLEAGGAFYINMGALLPEHGHSIPAAASRAAELGKPWVLDPVGIGIGSLRMQILEALKKTPPAIIRANASEVIALAGLWDVLGGEDALSGVRGVDSTDSVDAALAAAKALARFTGGAVAVSGEVDLVTDGASCVRVQGGSPLMGKVTGFGCSLGGVMGVYAAVTTPFIAAVAATAHYDAAATKAAARADAPGSFKVAFLDELYRLTPAEVASNPMTIEEA